MKKSIKITDAKIIVTLFTLALSIFTTVLVLNPGKKEIKPKKFVGIDAAGFKHYPDGRTERMEIKF